MKKNETKKRIFNTNVDYLDGKLAEYKEATGVGRTEIYTVIGRSSAFLGNIKATGVLETDLRKICAILDVDMEDTNLYIGGTPDYERPKPVNETEGRILELERKAMVLHNENVLLRAEIDYIKKELGISTDRKETKVVQKTT